MRYASFFILLLLLTCEACTTKEPVHREADLESRVIQYYNLQKQSYPNEQAYIDSLRPYIVPTLEGDSYTRYVVKSMLEFRMRNPKTTFSAQITEITSRENNREAKVITKDHYIYPGYNYEVYHITKWIFINNQWYRSAENGSQDHDFFQSF